MTLLESDLLAAIKALLESSQAMTMTGGNSFAAEDMVRYQEAVDWAQRVIVSAENGTN